MSTFSPITADVFNAATVKSGRSLSPEMVEMVATIKTITDDTIVYFIPFDDVKPANLRQSLFRASKLANVPIVVRSTTVDDVAGFVIGISNEKRARKSHKVTSK